MITEIQRCENDVFVLPVNILTVWRAGFLGRTTHYRVTFVPSKIKHTSSRKLWINHKIKQLRRHKQKAYNKARQTNLSLHWTQFKDLKRQMQKECRKSYNKYMSDIIHDSYVNSKKKKLFNFIKSLRKDYCGVPTLQKDGLRHDDNQAKASILNQYFSSVFTNDD